MELSQLPAEMVAAVADLLSARDLTACSAVCVGWRRAFNLDPVWRPHCAFSPQYFEEDTRVRPIFQTPFVEGSELDPLCEWRVAFMMQLHVLSNWRGGLFSTDLAELRTNNCLLMMDAADPHTHWMFLCCRSRDGLRLEVWNIRGTPYLHTTVKLGSIFKNIDEIMENSVNFKLHLANYRLLFIYDNLITVFNFSYPQYQLEFLYNFSFMHTAAFFTQRRISLLPEGNLSDVIVLGNLIFAVSYSARNRIHQFSPSVHVWDIKEAVKVKHHCVFEPKGKDMLAVVNKLSLTSGDSNSVVVVRTFDGDAGQHSRVRVFDRTKFEYSEFFVHVQFPVIWTAVAGDIVVLCQLVNPPERDCVFYFYHTNTSMCLKKTCVYNIYDPEKISSSSSKFTFMDLNHNIVIFDILNQQAVVNCLHPTKNRLKTVTMINDRILLLESKYRGTSWSFENVLVTSYEVWDYATTTKPLRLEQCFRSTVRSKFTFVKDSGVPTKLLTVVHPMYCSTTICINSFW